MTLLSGSRSVRWIGIAGLAAAAIVFIFGLIHCYQRGGQDFAVFHHAWRLVLSGEGQRIYSDSPDRFLYAPGFAWLLAPLGALPFMAALSVWNALKGLSLVLILVLLGKVMARSVGGRGTLAFTAIAALGVVMTARPLLIDMRYGQVNLFILAAAVAALAPRAQGSAASGWTVVQWAWLATMALAKLIALPLLAIPVLVTRGEDARRIRLERAGVVAGVLIVAVAPLASEGIDGLLDLYLKWKGALVSKGFPTESHNQSFLAFLHHYFSGEATSVLFRPGRPYRLGWAMLSPEALKLIGTAWTMLTAGIALGWILFARGRGDLRWIAVTIALLILPSHLVWKPYFVLTLPVAAVAALDAIRSLKSGAGSGRLVLWCLALLLLNFTGFDFVGTDWAARFEAGAIFLFVHLLLTVMAVLPSRESLRKPAGT